MTEGTSGVRAEVIFNKLINGFLQELFKCFQWLNANHLVSIVLFTRIVYKNGKPVGTVSTEGPDGEEFMETCGGIEVGKGW
jgi:hypothetical protein